MLDNENVGDDNDNAANIGNAENNAENPDNDKNAAAAADSVKTTRTRRRAASRPAGPPPEIPQPEPRPTGRSAVGPVTQPGQPAESAESAAEPGPERTRDRGAPKAAAEPAPAVVGPATVPVATFQPPTMVVFQPPEVAPPARRTESEAGRGGAEPAVDDLDADDGADDDDGADRPSRRRRRRGGRGRGRSKDTDGAEGAESGEAGEPADTDVGAEPGLPGDGTESAGQKGADAEDTAADDPPNTVVHVREPRAAEDEVQSVKGSTRLEAKKQRRREGREHGRRRPPIVTESEFLARRESVERVMAVRRQGERTQIAVLEDGVLVEHYVDRASHQSYVGNVYLGKVQNVLPSMEAAFVDIGKGRNAVLYAGEVNWDTAGLEGQPRRIESALRSGQSVLVQVTKDPLGHKGARLTSQISLPGRYLVYVPDGSMTGISRKLPDKERNRLKQILKKVMPENAGVIVRTAAEGATEEELSRDVSRLSAQWENIQRQAKTASAPALLYGEPDLTIRVVRDVFNEDFAKLAVAGDDSWEMVAEYIQYVAPHLADRTTKWTGRQDIFDAYRIDEQIAKALERKVWLPHGGPLVGDP